MFQFILQQGIAILERAAEGVMEMTIEAIHLISLFGIEVPYCFRLNDVESGSVLLIELLHLCNIVEAVVVIPEILDPTGSSAIFSRLEHEFGLNHMIRCFGEEAFQNSFVDGREDVGRQQRLNVLLFKTGW